MRKHTKFLARTVVLVAAGWFASCNSTIDNEPNVVLEVGQLTISPITSSANGIGGTCTYQVTPATATLKNLPKNALAEASPFNDILLQSVSIAYVWDDGAVTPATTAGLGGSVPANGSSSTQFVVISSATLGVTQPPDPVGNGRAGHTASLAMVFNGTTVSGDAVSTTTGGTLQVNSCVATFGACCAAGGSCSVDTEANCTASGGTYKGDGTSCSTSNICLGP